MTENVLDRGVLDRGILIGIRGVMGAGKDTLADVIHRQQAARGRVYQTHKFATKLREAASILVDVPVDRMYSQEDKAVALDRRFWIPFDFHAKITAAIRHVVGDVVAVRLEGLIANFKRVLCRDDISIIVILKEGTTVGVLLQKLGTECFRECVGENVWVDSLMRQWRDAGRPPYIIADVRFPNESAAVRAAGGVVIKIVRAAAERSDGRSVSHASETALNNEAADVTIENNGTLGELDEACLSAWPAIQAAAERNEDLKAAAKIV